MKKEPCTHPKPQTPNPKPPFILIKFNFLKNKIINYKTMNKNQILKSFEEDHSKFEKKEIKNLELLEYYAYKLNNIYIYKNNTNEK